MVEITSLYLFREEYGMTMDDQRHVSRNCRLLVLCAWHWECPLGQWGLMSIVPASGVFLLDFLFGIWCVDDGPFFNQKLDGRSRVEEAAVHHWTEPAVATASMFVNSWSSWCLESVDGDGQWKPLRRWRCILQHVLVCLCWNHVEGTN